MGKWGVPSEVRSLSKGERSNVPGGEGLEVRQTLAGVKMNNLQGDWGMQPGQRAQTLLPAFCDVGRVGRG